MTLPNELEEDSPDTRKTTRYYLHVTAWITDSAHLPPDTIEDNIRTDNRGAIFIYRNTKLHLDAEIEDLRDLNGKVRARVGKRLTDLLKEVEKNAGGG